MKITYLKHSGFVVEYEDIVLIFDYYRGVLPKFEGTKKMYVFSSHRHYDHFQRKIFEWDKQFPYVTYILSEDIPVKNEANRIVTMGPRQHLAVDELNIQTLRSTDEGVAFLVSLRGKRIYHAGDLNWWYWEEESPAFNELMKRNYQHEIRKIKGEQIDVAFVPLDARQGDQFYWGMDYFMKHTDTKYVFPMHMWKDDQVYGKLMQEPDAKPYRDKVMQIRKDGEEFELCV